MELNQDDISKKLNWRKILIPLALGIGAALYLLISNLNESAFMEVEAGSGNYSWVGSSLSESPNLSNPEEFKLEEGGNYNKVSASDLLLNLKLNTFAWVSLGLALLMVVFRDLGYMFRIRYLTDRKFSWKQSFRVIMLWEFASALTPSVVGGSGVAIFILNREGINLGKSTALVFITALLDEIFYILTVPAIFLIVGSEVLFPEAWAGSSFGQDSVKVLFYIGYGFIIFLTTLLLLSVFFAPYRFKRVMMNIFAMPLLRRFLRRIILLGDEVISASEELKGKKFDYWLKGFGSTFVSWTARFLTLNFILMAFAPNMNHFLAYGRQLVMWVIMLISPTPGSSGVAEIALSSFFEYLIPSGVLIAGIALIWRLLTYFPYLFIGAAILPKWLKNTSEKKLKK